MHHFYIRKFRFVDKKCHLSVHCFFLVYIFFNDVIHLDMVKSCVSCTSPNNWGFEQNKIDEYSATIHIQCTLTMSQYIIFDLSLPLKLIDWFSNNWFSTSFHQKRMFYTSYILSINYDMNKTKLLLNNISSIIFYINIFSSPLIVNVTCKYI